MLRILNITAPDINNGNGLRVTLWVSGCTHHCKGCHNEQAQPLNGGMDVPLRVLYEEFCSNPLVTGVTFSGGEPFIQSKSLAVLANVLKKKNYSIWAYSGFTFDKLESDPIRRQLLELVDVVVDGPFVMAKKSLELDFRGSSNQRIINVQESLKQHKVVLMEGYK